MKTRRISHALYSRNENFWMDRPIAKGEDIEVFRLGATLMTLYGAPQPEHDGGPGKAIIFHPGGRIEKRRVNS